MEHPSKRLRGNETFQSESAGITGSFATSNQDEQFIIQTQSIPPLVSNIFLGSLRNVELLKVCRLVCKSWNIPASESLRRCSVVCLQEGEPRLWEFRELLLRRSFGVWQQLPSPFQNFNLEGLTFNEPIFMNLALLPNISITSFQMELVTANQDLDQISLGHVLATNKANITDLTIIGDEGFELNEALFPMDELRLTALKSLTFQDYCYDCKHIPFVKNLVSLCMPDSVDLNVCDGNVLTNLLPQHQTKNLKYLEIKFLTISTDAWKHLGNLKFSRITRLVFTGKYRENEPDHRQQWRSICHNVSPFVESLTASLPLDTDSELRFPNLKFMCVPSFNVLSSFIPDRYPSLSNVMYIVPAQMISAPVRGLVPHVGVLSVNITVAAQNVTHPSFDQGLMNLLTYVSRQFPKAFQLGLEVSKFSSTTFTDIWERFPNLQGIKLNGECDFLSFSGMELSMITKYLELGWPVQEIPRRKSIIDFMELKTIIFGSKFVVDPDMIIHCLPRVPKLKQIKLHWNESLSVPLLRDSVGYLEKIVILNSSESEYQDQMVQVLNMLPNACLQ